MANPSAGLVKSNSMNTTKGRVPHNYSTFDESLSYKKYMLLRYADYTPSFEMEGVPDDDIRLNTKDFIDSLSLNSPFKGTIRKIKESFKVPNMAMLPFNWDLIYTQPAVGGDVPDDANTVISDFPSVFSTVWSSMFSTLMSNKPTSTSSDSDYSGWLTALLRVLTFGEMVYSRGSLLNFCGYKACAQFNHLTGSLSDGTYDDFFDVVILRIFQNIRFFTFTTNGVVKYYKGLAPISYLGATNERFFGSFRAFLDDFRDNPSGSISVSSSGTPQGYIPSDVLNQINTFVTNGVFDLSQIEFILPPASAPVYSEGSLTELNPNTLNYQRLVAYQLIYFHYYTNSGIDPIYSAELYRQYICSLERTITGTNLPGYFTLNGKTQSYDYLSGYMFARNTILTTSGAPVSINYGALSALVSPRFALFAAVFGFRHSLRYGDYFVGARTRPLAPINQNVSAAGGVVSVIDITQTQWSQRFANAVMRSRQKIDNYVDMLFGHKPEIDFHNPLYLSREVDVIYGDEVQNTGAEQMGSSAKANSRTANLRGGLGQFTFTFHNDDAHPCVYMQIISFDIKRAYTRSVDRQFLHIDRYDMFNPSFQYIGDQPIYGIELGYPSNLAATPLTLPAVFGYQSRDMEYKQRFDVVCGGFEKNLPGWILTDVDRSKSFNGSLDADFIRNYNSELDQFYLSLTGYSLGTYFHFICITQNNVYAKRSMAVDPQIMF